MFWKATDRASSLELSIVQIGQETTESRVENEKQIDTVIGPQSMSEAERHSVNSFCAFIQANLLLTSMESGDAESMRDGREAFHTVSFSQEKASLSCGSLSLSLSRKERRLERAKPRSAQVSLANPKNRREALEAIRNILLCCAGGGSTPRSRAFHSLFQREY